MLSLSWITGGKRKLKEIEIVIKHVGDVLINNIVHCIFQKYSLASSAQKLAL